MGEKTIIQVIQGYISQIKKKRDTIRKLEDQISDLEDLKTMYLASLVGANLLEEIENLKKGG